MRSGSLVSSGISRDSGRVAEVVIGLRNRAGDCTHQYSSQTPMKESSSVLITSLVPAFTFMTAASAPHAAPATTAASIGRMKDSPSGRAPTCP